MEEAWKETVKEIFDTLHFGEDNLFTGNSLAKRLVRLIEERHPDWFVEPMDDEASLPPGGRQ